MNNHRELYQVLLDGKTLVSGDAEIWLNDNGMIESNLTNSIGAVFVDPTVWVKQ